ncbi:MAG: ribonuclease P protein component [Clostridia bacterium]|nr:ribonuclease P protein component [Clostridia bacterium]
MKEIYRLNEESEVAGKSIVFLAKKNINISEIQYKDIREDMIEILKKIR